MAEGEDSYLRVVDICAESIARRAESRKWAGAALMEAADEAQ